MRDPEIRRVKTGKNLGWKEEEICASQRSQKGHHPKVSFSFVGTICMGEPAVLRRVLPIGVPGVLRSKAMLTCHVRNMSCTAPLTGHFAVVGKNSDRETALFRHQTQNHT